MTTHSIEDLKHRKTELEGLLVKMKTLYQRKMLDHDDHVERSCVAVTSGILSILNKNPKASATYRRSLNADIQLHRKIQLRNLFLLRIRERAMQESLQKVKDELAALGYVEEPVTESTDAADTVDATEANLASEASEDVVAETPHDEIDTAPAESTDEAPPDDLDALPTEGSTAA